MHKRQTIGTSTICALMLLATAGVSGQEMVEVTELDSFTVYAGSGLSGGAPANQLTERMAREARVDLQSRGGTRYQTDISIRGGIFEGTGLQVGGMTLFDPQTGHYFSEIPLDPGFFGGAYLLTGVDNGVRGFNSTAGTINWEWAPIHEGGHLYARVGTDSYYGGGIRYGAAAGDTRYEIGLMHESGDGSIANGDFELTRLSGRLEYALGDAKLRIFGGYLDKFYGWPGMYTGFALNETDDYQVALLGWQLEKGTAGDEAWHRVGGYWRTIVDDYEFRREEPNTFFEHKTEVYSLQGDGGFRRGQTELLYNWSWVKDRIIRSTSLVNGDFTERDYGKASVLGRQRLDTEWGELLVYGGASIDTSNEDSTVGSPQLGVRTHGVSDGISWSAYLEYSETSQVPGYTVLNSGPSGLFGGNKDLGREHASTVEGGYSFHGKSLSGKVVGFFRQDENLIDWVYDSSVSTTARRAAEVDMDVYGVEALLRWESGARAVEVGYAWLDKDEDYGTSGGDASFYALNYARHRILLTIEQELAENVTARIEGEYRKHPVNILRVNGDEALRLNAELTWESAFGSDWDFNLRGLNLTKEDFQTVPGTPGPGREIILTASLGW